MTPGTCKHFNGVQHATCDAGLAYPSPLPCITRLATQSGASPCPCYEEPTAEEVAAEEAETEATLQRFKLVNDRLPRKPGTRGAFDCPVCGGTIHYSIAYNGHARVACSSPECVRWLE